MWPLFIVVSTPSLQLFRRIGKVQEPMGVQAFRPQPAVERLDERVVGRLAGAREVEDDAALISPEIEIAGDELRALLHTDRLGIAGLPRSEEHTSELQSLMRISYAVFCLKKKNTSNK